MRTIPEIRDRLFALAEEHGIPELASLAEETRRRFNGRKAPVRSVFVTDDLAAQVQAYAAKHPKASMHDIGERFGINQGRVSEILFGRREDA